MGTHNGYQIFSRRVILKGTLTLLSGSHIGAGRAFGVAASDSPVLKDINNQPFIPGSSLKGVLRSNVEAFLRSFQSRVTPYLACCQVSRDAGSGDRTRRPCISADRKKELRRETNADVRIWQESCWVCQFFGSPWIASKAQFVDLSLVSAWAPQLLAVRDGVVIDRESETAAEKGKFDFEVIPPGTQFGVEILLENPEDYELGMLMLGIGFLNDGLALLGGNTSRGLGRVRLDIHEAIDVKPDQILACLRSEQAPAPAELQPAQETPSSASDETTPQPADEAQGAMHTCLQQSGKLNYDGLISAMQERGWTKARLQGQGYANWKKLFESALRASIIAQTGEEFHLPREKPEEPVPTPSEAFPSQEEKERSRKHAEAQQKAIRWKDALHHKLKEALEGGK